MRCCRLDWVGLLTLSWAGLYWATLVAEEHISLPLQYDRSSFPWKKKKETEEKKKQCKKRETDWGGDGGENWWGGRLHADTVWCGCRGDAPVTTVSELPLPPQAGSCCEPPVLNSNFAACLLPLPTR
uniref:Uncharacterized protein n=1 Tax=Leersia perrieri TaxID=77586 RepID=A0A0D9VN00_9ORYZ